MPQKVPSLGKSTNLYTSEGELMSRLTEGRKANILKMLSQLHAYLARYDDLDKAETHFQQRMEDAGCSDMYAVIDEVLDVVDTAKKSEKAKLLNKIYKAYFPKSAKAEPATDEEVESAMDTHHLDGVGEEAIKDEAEESDSSEDATNENDEVEEDADEGVTLGDVRKPEEDYVAAAANGGSDEDDSEDEEDEEGEELEEGLYSMANRSRVLGDMKRTSVMSDEELDKLYNDAICPEYRAIDPSITDELHRAVAAAKHGGADEDEFFERTIKQARFYSKKLREDLDEIDDLENDDEAGRFDDGFADDVDLFKRDSAAGIEDDLEFADDEMNDEDFDEFDPAVDSEESLAEFPEPSQAKMGNYPVGYDQSLQDAAEELIADLIASGIDNDEDLVEAIVQELSDPEHPMERGMASDMLEDYYEMNDPANENATEGDMEQEYEDMAMDGWSDDEIIQKLIKKYGLTRHEIEMSIGGAMTRNRMPEPVDEVDEYPTVDDEEEFEPEEGENGLPFSEKE